MIEPTLGLIDKFGIDTIIFLLFIVGITIAFIKWHLDDSSTFDISSVIVDGKTNKFSLSKFGQLVALVISTWIIVHQTLNNQLTEWLFTGYMLAWAGANFLNKYISKSPQTDSPPTKLNSSK